MGRIKSAIVLTLITLIIAVLCVVCFVPFPLGGDGIHYFNPIINWADKTSDLGGYQYGEDAGYLGGAYTVVLYPEGVISAKEYHDNGETENDTEYVPYANGSVYLDKEEVCGGGTEPTEEFKAAFATQLDCLKERFSRLHAEGATLEVRDGYTVRATLPSSLDASVAAFLYFSYMGDVTVLYGTSSDAASASQVIPETGKDAKPASEYIKGASMRTNVGTVFVEVDFTSAGLDILSDATSGAADSTGYLFVQVGGETVINLSVSEQIHDNLYISGSYTNDSARVVASTIDTALDYEGDLGMTMGELHHTDGSFGSVTLGSLTLTALDLVYIAFGVLFVAMAVFFLIRYGLLGFANILSYLLFLPLMVLLYWSVPITIGAGSIAAFAISSVLLCVSNAVAYEAARKEYAVGKTIASSVKTGYKKTFWHIFDLHIALVIVALLVYLIAITELSLFGLALTFGVALSGICSLLVNRFLWYVTMGLSKNPGKFCHFKREEVEDDD